jgi:hypothetical protein
LKKAADGAITQSVVIPKHLADTHNSISVGMDREGYIHVAGDMHHSPLHGQRPDDRPHLDTPWQYWVSEKPRDVSKFRFVGDTPMAPPGTRLSYARFYHAPDGTLYLGYRQGVIGQGYTYGVMAGALARYSESERRWFGIGGTNPFGICAFAWTDQGCPTSVTGYQAYKMNLAFDSAGGIHVVWVLFGERSPGIGAVGAQYLMYACSTDRGRTWRRADGTVIDGLPVTESNGDLVFEARGGGKGLANVAHVFPDPGGVPTVAFRSDGQDLWSTFRPGAGWETPRPGRDMYALAARNGNLILVRPGLLMRSSDRAHSWKDYTVPQIGGNTFPHDVGLARSTDLLRLVTQGDDGRLDLWTVRIGHPEGG